MNFYWLVKGGSRVENIVETHLPAPFDRGEAGIIDKQLLSILVCPVTKAPLEYDETAQELVCRASGLAYPIRDGVPVMLENEARTLGSEERLSGGSGRRGAESSENKERRKNQ